MTDTPRKTPDIDPALLLGKRDRLLAERTDIRKTRAALGVRDREIDRELADIQAAGRVFGIEIDLPKEEEDAWQRSFFEAPFQRTIRRLIMEPKEAAPETTAAAKAVATKAEMPRISDIVLDRLKEAAERGTKAAPIQAYIENTYGKKIHDKTVGMTLYRLQREGRVRRQGHTWFIVPETMNPGVAAPGSEKSPT
jgi:hypothetical protein